MAGLSSGHESAEGRRRGQAAGHGVRLPVRFHYDNYLNTSSFLGRTSQLTYVVQEFVPGERIRLRGENKTVISVGTMSLRRIDGDTEVTYAAEFTFKGPARFIAPLLRPALDRLGQHARTGLYQALNKL